MKTDLQPFYTIVDLMLLFGVSESTIRRWLADARKGINMFTGEKVNIPVLGLVENMAWFTPAELPGNT